MFDPYVLSGTFSQGKYACQCFLVDQPDIPAQSLYQCSSTRVLCINVQCISGNRMVYVNLVRQLVSKDLATIHLAKRTFLKKNMFWSITAKFCLLDLKPTSIASLYVYHNTAVLYHLESNTHTKAKVLNFA